MLLFIENGGFDALQFQDVPIEVQQSTFGPAHLGLGLGKASGLLRQSGLVLVGIRARENRRPHVGFLKAMSKRGFLALSGLYSLLNCIFYRC